MDDSLRYTGNILYFTIEKKNKVMIWNKTLNCTPFCFFPVTIAGTEEANFPSKFTKFCNFILCCFPFAQIHKQ